MFCKILGVLERTYQNEELVGTRWNKLEPLGTSQNELEPPENELQPTRTGWNKMRLAKTTTAKSYSGQLQCYFLVASMHQTEN